MTKASEIPEGDELDRLIALKVMGLRVEREPAGFSPGEHDVWRNKQGHTVSQGATPRYSTDRVLAMAVVDRMRSDWFSFTAWQPSIISPEDPVTFSYVSFVCGSGPCPRHKTDFHNHHGAYRVQAPTLALAICRGALVALKLAEPDPEEC